MNKQEKLGVIFDKIAGKWVRLTPEGGSVFVADKAQASVIDVSELDAYIRNYELDYLRSSLVIEPLSE